MKYSKEELEAMSDFELNWKIAETQKGESGVVFVVCGDAVFRNDLNGCIPIIDEVDYCNNPSDIMPLVFEFGISLIAPSHNQVDYWNAIGEYRDGYGGCICVSSWHDTNPLRAAAIVYILIKQGEL